MTTLPYQYSVLRAVPRVHREEFVNVGVVLFCDRADFLRCGCALDPARLRALDPDVDLRTLRAMLDAVDVVCAGQRRPGLPTFDRPGRRFGWLTAPRSTVLQPGPVHSGVTGDPADELERLVASLVA